MLWCKVPYQHRSSFKSTSSRFAPAYLLKCATMPWPSSFMGFKFIQFSVPHLIQCKWDDCGSVEISHKRWFTVLSSLQFHLQCLKWYKDCNFTEKVKGGLDQKWQQHRPTTEHEPKTKIIKRKTFAHRQHGPNKGLHSPVVEYYHL